MRLLDNKKDWFLFWVALVMVALNLTGFILSANAHNAYNKMQEETNRVKQQFQQYSGIYIYQEDDIDVKLQSLLDTLSNGSDRLKQAMWVFGYRLMCGIMLAPILMLIGKLYDLLSPFSEIWDYMELLNEMQDVITEISYKMLQIIQ